MIHLLGFRAVIPFALAVAVLSACAPSSKAVRTSDISVSTAGLQLDRSQSPTLVFKRSDAPALATYNRFIIDPVRVDYRDPNIKELDSKDVARMAQYFQSAMVTELRKGGYQVGTRSQANTLRVSLTIKGLKAPSAAANVTAIVAPIALSVGEVTVEGVFREALSNRIDAVVLERTEGSRFLNDTPWSTWADIKNAFDGWATGFRKAIDAARGK